MRRSMATSLLPLPRAHKPQIYHVPCVVHVQAQKALCVRRRRRPVRLPFQFNCLQYGFI